jgi:hypothetical protein
MASIFVLAYGKAGSNSRNGWRYRTSARVLISFYGGCYMNLTTRLLEHYHFLCYQKPLD